MKVEPVFLTLSLYGTLAISGINCTESSSCNFTKSLYSWFLTIVWYPVIIAVRNVHYACKLVFLTPLVIPMQTAFLTFIFLFFRLKCISPLYNLFAPFLPTHLNLPMQTYYILLVAHCSPNIASSSHVCLNPGTDTMEILLAAVSQAYGVRQTEKNHIIHKSHKW